MKKPKPPLGVTPWSLWNELNPEPTVLEENIEEIVRRNVKLATAYMEERGESSEDG